MQLLLKNEVEELKNQLRLAQQMLKRKERESFDKQQTLNNLSAKCQKIEESIKVDNNLYNFKINHSRAECTTTQQQQEQLKQEIEELKEKEQELNQIQKKLQEDLNESETFLQQDMDKLRILKKQRSNLFNLRDELIEVKSKKKTMEQLSQEVKEFYENEYESTKEDTVTWY